MNLLMLIFAIAAFAVNSVAIRIFQIHIGRDERDTDLFQGLFCLIAAVTYFAVSGFTYDLSAKALVFSVLFGLFFASASLFSAFCYACGPMSVTSVITNASVIIPVIYGCIALRETITLWQITGCVLLTATFLISASGSNDKSVRVNTRWFIFVLIAFFSNGITAVLQKEYKLSVPVSGGNMFMAIAYLTAAILFFAIFIILSRVNKKEVYNKKVSHFALFAVLVLLAGLGSFAGNGIMFNLSIKLPASVLYPFINGGLCITVSIVSCLLLHEKLTKHKIAAILVGLCAVVALNL